jgi:hypothetical protein
MKKLISVAAVLAAVGMLAGCFTSATAYTETTHADGSVTVSKVKVIGTGDKASQIASEGLFADGTAEDLGAGVKTASASQTSTGIDGTLAGLGTVLQGMAQFMAATYAAGIAGNGTQSASVASEAGRAQSISEIVRGPSVDRSSVSGVGGATVAIIGNRKTCAYCRTLWAGLDAAALSDAVCGAAVIDADATANAAEYAKYKPDGPFAYPLIRVYGADGKLAGELSGRGLSQATIVAKVKTLIGCK